MRGGRPRWLVLTAAVAAAFGQQEPPTFRAGATLVEFTIVALDHQGNPVTDLRQGEVLLTENGRPRELAFLRFEGATLDRPEPEPAPLPAGTFSNRPEYSPSTPRHVMAIMLDALNTPAEDQISVRQQALEYLRTVPPDTRVGVFLLTDDLVVLQDFTGGAASVAERVEETLKKYPPFVSSDVEDLECFASAFRAIAMSGRCESRVMMPISSAESVFFQQRAERRRNLTLASLEAVGNYLAGIPGRKSLVCIGGGVSNFSATGAQRRGDGHVGFRSYEEQIRETARRLASQGVALYPVDSLGLVRASGDSQVQREGSAGRSRLNVWASNPVLKNVVTVYDPIAAMDAMAEITGGRAVKYTNDLAKGMTLAAADERATYTAGFYAVAEPDNQWHTLRVTVNRSGLRLTHREGYIAEAPAAEPLEWTTQQWATATDNPLGSTAIPLDVRCVLTERDERPVLTTIVQIESRDLSFRHVGDAMQADLEIALAQKIAEGRYTLYRQNVTVRLAGQQSGLARWEHHWPITPETTTIRLVARDRLTGRYGTVEIPVQGIPRMEE